METSLEASQIQGKLSVEEAGLFNAAAEAAAAYQRWRSQGDSRPLLGRGLSLKRKWAAEEEQQQQDAAAAGRENVSGNH